MPIQTDFKCIVDGGFIYDILTALGINTDFDMSNDYGFVFSLFCISISVVFIVLFVVILFRCISSLFKGARI